jgi:hypothetical protein
MLNKKTNLKQRNEIKLWSEATSLLDVRRSMFDVGRSACSLFNVGRSSFNMLDVHLSKQLSACALGPSYNNGVME